MQKMCIRKKLYWEKWEKKEKERCQEGRNIRFFDLIPHAPAGYSIKESPTYATNIFEKDTEFEGRTPLPPVSTPSL